jgi:hypothetical protein
MMKKMLRILIPAVLLAGLASAQIWSEDFDPAPVLNEDGFGVITNVWSTGQWIHTKASNVSNVVEGVTNLVLQLRSDGGVNVGDTEGAGISLDGGLFSSAGTYAVEVAVLSDSNSVGALGLSIYDADIGSGGTNNYRLDTKKNAKNAWLDVTAVGDASATLLAQAKLAAGTTNQVAFSYDGSGDVVLMLGAMQRWVDVQSLLKIDDISVDVATANNAPVFSADSITNLAAGAEGAAYSDTIAGAATDVDPDTLSYYKVFGPDWLVVASDGSLSGTPPNGADGLNQFEVWVTDGKGGYDGVDLEITVTDALNDAPVFTSDPIIKKFAFVELAYSESMSVDVFDNQGDPITFSKVGYTGFGADWLQISTNGTLTGTPAGENLGAAEWQVEISDGLLASTGTLAIAVNPPAIWSEDFETTVLTDAGTDGIAYVPTDVTTNEWIGADGNGADIIDSGTSMELKVYSRNQTDDRNRGAAIALGADLFSDGAGDYILNFDYTFRNQGNLVIKIWEASKNSGSYGMQVEDTTTAPADGSDFLVIPTGDAVTNLLVEQTYVAGDDGKNHTIDFSYGGIGDVVIQIYSTGKSRTQQVDNLGVFFAEDLANPYAVWASSYELVYGPDGDDDLDGLVNLYEYALGLDPTNTVDPNAVADGALPTFGNGSGGMEYIHAQRKGDSSLTYYLELDGDLVNAPGWTNVGYTVTGTNVTEGTFDYVTNAIPTTDARKFIRLVVEQQ